jgi:hypothetical protein
MSATTRALNELESYCAIAIKHSHDQYEKHGTLHGKAALAFEDPTVWEERWVPDDFDVCEARTSDVWDTFSREQKLAWNHLQWCLDYSAVAQGERQLIVLNAFASADYARVLPSVCVLEERESFEETDHIAAFTMVIDACRDRYFRGRKESLWSIPASGFGSERLNRRVRNGIGTLGRYLLGSNFPTLYFLARGMKTHGFKPFENAITTSDATHTAMKTISHLHRLDESRHMATSLHLARLSSQVLDTLPKDNLRVFQAACQAAFPHRRSAAYRLSYWRKVLDESTIYADVPKPARERLYRHLEARIGPNLEALHDLQTRLTRQANKRIVEECGLSPAMKRAFVAHMRADSAYAATVDAVDLDACAPLGASGPAEA